MSMRLRAMLLAVALLAGCEDQGTIERDQLSDLSVGRTTSTELTSLWGPPLRNATMPDGRRVWTYRTIHLQTGPIAAFAPGFGPIGSTSDATMGQVTLTFDDQGVLLSYTYTR
jgi:hypothetical protein